MVAGAAVVVLGIAAIGFAVTGSDASPQHPTSAADGSTPVAANVLSTNGSDATAPLRATTSPATNADGTPTATDASGAPAPTSPTTRASQSQPTVRAPKATAVSGAPVISNEATADAAMGAEHCPHASEPVQADVTPTDGVTVTLRWTDPEGIESSRVLHAPDSGVTFTSTLGPFAEGSITWWMTATDSKHRTATTIHHLVAVDAC